ncbi:hypothetical protein GCM10010517_27120 [Streptosporangium fragile]|uniref:DUF5753 domain-containing protein n=1 Tax=Streptosporangium fragile TaxID=46186 RepID=A0ABN3VXG4_9ACTN
MTQHATPAEPQGVVDEATAERHDRALVTVQRLLIERGIRAHRHHTISLRFASDRPASRWPRSWTDRHPPELAVIGPQGGREATVTVGPRSGCYLVSLRNGPDLQAVKREHPEQVVELILAAWPGEPS